MKQLGAVFLAMILLVLILFGITVYEVKVLVPEEYHFDVTMNDSVYLLPMARHIGVLTEYDTFEGEHKKVYLKSPWSVKYLRGDWDFYHINMKND